VSFGPLLPGRALSSATPASVSNLLVTTRCLVVTNGDETQTSHPDDCETSERYQGQDEEISGTVYTYTAWSSYSRQRGTIDGNALYEPVGAQNSPGQVGEGRADGAEGLDRGNVRPAGGRTCLPVKLREV